MKLKVLALVALVMLAIVPLASAQVGTWDSSFTVVNLGTADATVDVTFYDDAGTSYHPSILNVSKPNPFTLAAGSSFIVYLPGIPAAGLPDGRYSVVISADQPIVAIANLVGIDGQIAFNASYSGMVDEGQTHMYMPSVNKDFYGWNSHLSIQNLTSAAMDITVDFYAGTPVVIATVTQNVPAYSSWHLDVADVAALPTMYNGSAVVHAAGPIAAIDNQTVDTLGYTQDYNGFLSGATALYCPALYKDFYTWGSSLNVQNIGATTTTVTVQYTDWTTTYELGPNAAYLFYQPAEPHTLTTFAAIVTADQPLVAIVNAANPATQAQTYNCFALGNTSFYAPFVAKNYYGWDTAVQVQNLGTVTATVTITYETPGCSSTKTIGPGNADYFYQPLEACLPDGYGASAEVTSDQPIVAVVNQTYGAGQTGDQGDWSMSYNMFGQ